MSIDSTNNSESNINPINIDSKLVHEETPKSNITFESLEVDANKIDALFQQVNTQQQEQINEKILLRQQKKAAIAAKKNLAANKEKKDYNVVLPKTKTIKKIDLLHLSFSQDSIDSVTHDKTQTINDLATNISEKGWKTGTALQIISMPDGMLVSMNNRRLYAVKLALKSNETLEIPVEIYKHNDKAPNKLMKGIENEYKTIHGKAANIDLVPENIELKSYGHCVVLRVNTRQKDADLKSAAFGYKEMLNVREGKH